MVRQRPRKTLDEVYGTKFEAAKSTVNNGKNTQNMRDYGYIINSNTPYSTSNPPLPPPPSSSITNTPAINSSRRKSARPYGKTGGVGGANGPKYQGNIKEEKEDTSKEHNSAKMKTSRVVGGGGGAGNEKCPFAAANQYDNKTYRPYSEGHNDLHMAGDGSGVPPNSQQHQHHPHNQHHNHHNNRSNHHHDDDKDDDTEEFFQLIRQTVEHAIGKSISELLNRNFRELGSKVERFSSELKNTNDLLGKIQMDLHNKVVHYGEENSRHFRYLCMKSEYDKMFYQHQSMMSAAVVPSNTSHKLEKRNSPPKTNMPKGPNATNPTIGVDEKSAPCTCRSSSKVPPSPVETKEPQKSSSDEQNVSQKSSEVGMREVLEHIQRFCMQMKFNQKKVDQPSVSKHISGIMGGAGLVGGEVGGGGDVMADYHHHQRDIQINEQIFEDDDDDDDDFCMSSDGMTPRSDENLDMSHQYGGMTMRACSATQAQCLPGGDGDTQQCM